MTLEGVRFKTVRPAAAYLEVVRGYQIKLVHTVPNSIFHQYYRKDLYTARPLFNSVLLMPKRLFGPVCTLADSGFF